MKSITRDIVSALIFSKDGKLLMGTKDPNAGGAYSDCWHLPGGGVDEGESLKDALVREVKEETGIDVTEYKFTKVDYRDTGEAEKTLKDTGEKVMCKMTFYIYAIEIPDLLATEVPVHLGDDLVEYHWFDENEIKAVKLTPPSIKLFKHLNFFK